MNRITEERKARIRRILFSLHPDDQIEIGYDSVSNGKWMKQSPERDDVIFKAMINIDQANEYDESLEARAR